MADHGSAEGHLMDDPTISEPKPGLDNVSSQSSAQRAFTLYRAPSETSSTSVPALPDSFFQHSGADVRAAQTALASRVQALTNAPLMTQSMRESTAKSRRERWPQTTIRIRFHDRMQLETSFASTDTIKTVAAFLRSSFKENIKAHKFILYQAPPKREFRVSDPEVKGKSLHDLQLTPSSVLQVKFLDDSLDHLPTSELLSDQILLTTKDLPTPVEVDPAYLVPTPVQTSASSPQSNSTQSQKAVPKWLKLGSVSIPVNNNS